MKDVFSGKPWLKSYDADVPAGLTYPNATCGQVLTSICARYPDRPALIFMGAQMTYRELDELSNRFAHFLIRQGCKPGDVVGYHGPNLPAGSIATVGIHKAGCVYTGVSPLYTPEELKYQLIDSGAKVLVTFEPLLGAVSKIIGETGIKAVLVTAGSDFIPNVPVSDKELPSVPGIHVKRFKSAIEEMPSDSVLTVINPADSCTMMYTGGTTGVPKGAVATQRMTVANVTQYISWFGMRQGDEIFLSAFPFFHAAGNTVQLMAYFLGATNILLPDPRDYQKAVTFLKQYRPTLFGHVPTVFMELMKLPEFRALDFSGVRYLVSGASPYPAEKIRELEDVVGTSRLVEAYGMTEGVCICLANPYRGRKKIGSVGLPISDSEAKIVNPDTGNVVGIGEEGELMVRGPQIMKGYHNKPEETAQTLLDGWLHTGDIAKMDEDGYFYLVDRLKDMISVSGLKVFSRQVDDVVAEYPDVAMCATIGLPDPNRPGSEIVACAISLKPGVEKSDVLEQKIKQYLKERLAPYKVPKVIEFVDQLPLSSVGKVLKRELRKKMEVE